MATLTTLTNGTTADADVVMANFNAINNDYANQVGYSAYMGLQEGVFAGGDLMVTQRGAGANMSVDVAGGQAMVQDDASTQGLLVTIYKAALTNVSISAANATNPRVDQVVMSKAGTISVVAGTATSGATLDNRTGAAALPVSSVRLADILVPAASSSVSNTNVRDRRPWARGARAIITRTANAAAGSDYATSATTMAAVDATNLAPRIECSGLPVRLTIQGVFSHSVNNGLYDLGFAQDGVLVDGITEASLGWQRGTDSMGTPSTRAERFVFDTIPTAGSHTFAPWFDTVTAGTITLWARAAAPLRFIVEETLQQNSANNTATSG